MGFAYYTVKGSPELLAIREPQQDNKPKYPHLFFIWAESKSKNCFFRVLSGTKIRIDFTNMKNFALYYQIKKMQCLVLPTITFFIILFIFNEMGVDKNPCNTIIGIITILIGYYYSLQEVKSWDDCWEILIPAIFILGSIVFLLYGTGIYITQQTAIDEQINNWILTHIGNYFSDCCLIITWVILLIMTTSKIMSTIIPFNNLWEKNWYLENDAPNSEKGEAWVFYKNGKLIITSPRKGGTEKSCIYSWKFNPQMKSIILLSEERTQVFFNFNVQDSFLDYQSLSFTSNQPNSLYQFSSMMPKVTNAEENDKNNKNQSNASIELQEKQ